MQRIQICNVLAHKLAPVHESMERPKIEADCSRLVGGRFNKQENLHTRLVLDS